MQININRLSTIQQLVSSHVSEQMCDDAARLFAGRRALFHVEMHSTSYSTLPPTHSCCSC